jgi:membrane associated rhomboid family serine protease
MGRQPSRYSSSFSFGSGRVSTAIKALIGANVALFVAQILAGALFPADRFTGADVLTTAFGLMPARVMGQLYVWQLASYMFLHGGVFHLLFNMLALWMFGTELERTWGTRYFLKFYFVTGIGAAVLTVLFSLLPFDFARGIHQSIVIGASGAIYGLLLAYGLYFPDRPIYMYLVFPIPAKYFVMIMGALAFYSSFGDAGGVASATHLGGLVVGYLYLKGARIHPLSELKYRYVKWKISRVRKKFDVYAGGRADNDWNRRLH